MGYLEIPIPDQHAHMISIGDKVTLNAFTPDIYEAFVVDLRQGTPNIRPTMTVEVPGGTAVPAGAMIQTPMASWAVEQALFVPEERAMSKPIMPGAYIPPPRAPGFDIDFEGLQQRINELLRVKLGDELLIQAGDEILQRVLKPIVDSFIGHRSDEAKRQIEGAWQSAVALLEQGDLLPAWMWEGLREKLMTTADEIITKVVEESPMVPPRPQRLKVERPDAPWLLDE